MINDLKQHGFFATCVASQAVCHVNIQLTDVMEKILRDRLKTWGVRKNRGKQGLADLTESIEARRPVATVDTS